MLIKYNKTIFLFVSILFYYHSYSQQLFTKKYEYRHIQTTNESDIKSRTFVFSPAVGFGKSNTYSLDIGYGIKREISDGGGGAIYLTQGGAGYFQSFNNTQHYLRAFAEFDFMFVISIPPPSISLRLNYVNGYMFGSNEQYIIPEIGYNLVYGDLSASFPIGLQKAHNLYISFNIRGHIFAKIVKSQEGYVR